MNLQELLQQAAAARRVRRVRARVGWAAWTMKGAAVYTSTESPHLITNIRMTASVRLAGKT